MKRGLTNRFAMNNPRPVGQTSGQDRHRRVADLTGRCDTAGTGIDFGRRAMLDYTPFAHHQNISVQHECLLRLRTGIDGNRVAIGEDAAELSAQVLAQLVVKVDQRLVQQDQTTLAGNGAGNGDALLLATGQFQRETVEELRDPDDFGHFANPLADCIFSLPRVAQRRRDVFKDSFTGVVDELLIDHSDRALAHIHTGHVETIDDQFARSWRSQPGQNSQQRGFTGARGPDHGGEAARFKGQVEGVQPIFAIHLQRDLFGDNTHDAASLLIAAPARFCSM